MKLTKTKLKEMIREEIQKLDEDVLKDSNVKKLLQWAKKMKLGIKYNYQGDAVSISNGRYDISDPDEVMIGINNNGKVE